MLPLNETIYYDWQMIKLNIQMSYNQLLKIIFGATHFVKMSKQRHHEILGHLTLLLTFYKLKQSTGWIVFSQQQVSQQWKQT